MPFTSNSVLLSLSFLEGAALFFLLILYAFFAREFPQRFLNFWIAGWAALTSVSLSRVVLFEDLGMVPRLLAEEFSFFAGVLFLACILDYTGRGRRLSWLWAFGFLSAAGLGVLKVMEGAPAVAGQGFVWIDCALYISAGWLLWRHRDRERCWAQALLAAVLLLKGLHGMDRPDWPNLDLFLVRSGWSAVLDLAMGIAMVVFVLEARRYRSEEFEQSLRGMARITATAAESLRVERTLQEVLPPLVECAGATHGMAHLFENSSEKSTLVLRASTGFSGRFLAAHFRLPATESWICQTLERGMSYFASPANSEGELRKWMESEKLSSLALARFAGNAGPLGILTIGCQRDRQFQGGHLQFLGRIADLLGTTIQSVQQFEEASWDYRQWLNVIDTVGDLILVHGLDHRIIRVNRGVAERLGKTPEELNGAKMCDLLRRGKKSWVNCPYCEAAGENAETPDPVFGGSFLISNSDFYAPGDGRTGTIHVLREFAGPPVAESKYQTVLKDARQAKEDLACLGEELLQSEQCQPGKDSAAGKLLLVDGEEAALEIEQEILRGRGLCVLPVQTARMAVEILEREPIDGVVLDVQLPGEISGWGLYRWIESHRPELAGHVVFTFSSGAEEEARVLVGNCGCPALQKPVEPGEFWEAIGQVLAREVPASVKG